MRKLVLVVFVFLLAGLAYGQNLPKGCVFGLHQGEPVVLNPGFTVEQYVSFMNEKFIPEYEKTFQVQSSG